MMFGSRVVKGGFFDRVAFEQKPEASKSEPAFQVMVKASAKTQQSSGLYLWNAKSTSALG